MPYRLYITNKNYSSWSMRVWVLMRALRISFEERLLAGQETEVQAAFLTISPTGKVPCLHVSSGAEGGRGQDLAIWESLAIAEFLAERHPAKGVWPPLARKNGEARAWARSAAAEMHAGFGAVRREMTMNCGVRVRLAPGEPSPALARELRRLDELWAEGLRRFGGPWLAGEAFTAADAFFAPVACRLRTYGMLERGLASKEATEYAGRLLGHEAVREWVDAGVEETFREKGHEDEITMIEGRVIVEDFRARA